MKIDFNPAVIANGCERIVLQKLKYYHGPNNECEFRREEKKNNNKNNKQLEKHTECLIPE